MRGCLSAERRASSTQTASRPKLMYVLALAPSKIGGVEKFLRYLAETLEAAGWDLVLCFEGTIAPEFREYIAGPGTMLELLPNQGNLGLACAGALWRLLRKYRPAIFVYAFHGVMRVFPWLAKLGGARRIFFNDHSSRPPGQVPEPLSLPKRVAGHFLTLPLTAIVSVAEFTQRTGRAFGLTSASGVVIQNGVELPVFDWARGAAFRARYDLPEDAVVVVQVCWMVEVKGVETLLRAATQLLQRRRNVHFILAGDGPKLNEYRALAKTLALENSVTFTGKLANPTEMGLFEAANIYCQPSLWQEASPLAVLEAMSFKLPVVASNIGGLPELVQEGNTGYLVATGDSDGLCQALERLVDDSRLRERLGNDGYQAVLRKHRIERVAERYVELFLDTGSNGIIPGKTSA